MHRFLASTALIAVTLVACGGSAGLVGTPAAVELSVTVDPGDGKSDTATLRCSNEGATGTRWMADQTAAEAACDVVEANTERLTEGEPMDQVCTQQYGGPHTADVTGTVDGTAVQTSFHRANGCGIGDWETFSALLGQLAPIRIPEG
jgi:hypothetical protein